MQKGVATRRSSRDQVPDGCVGAFVGHTRGVTAVSSRGDGRHLLSNSKDHR